MSIAAPFLQVAEWLSEPSALLARDGQLLAVNRSAAEQLGIPPGELTTGQSLAEWLEIQPDAWQTTLQQWARTRAPIPALLHFRHSTNAPMAARFRGGVYLTRSPERPAILMVQWQPQQAEKSLFLQLNERIDALHREMEQRRIAQAEQLRLESKMQQAQKLESLGVLAGGVAHDFNNLLTSILGYTDLARTAAGRNSPVRRFLDDAIQGIRRAAELTQQMLAYSGKGKFVIQPVRLSTLVEEMSRLLEVSITKKCVLKFDFLPNLPTCEGDPSQLRQVIMNLIINAAEAIGDRSGVISITTGVMMCDRAYLSEVYLDDDLAEGMYVYVEVADTGSGMDETTRQRIFEPFFTTKFTGRGLGLAAVLGIVRGHRGAIKVYSELNRGTTFKVLFPASQQPEQIDEYPNQDLELWGGSGTILLVDDEESIRALVQQMLTLMGFDVLVAADGLKAVEQFRAHADSIRLVLLDMTMPRMDGEETFRELRRIRPNVRAILSSGYNEQTATSRFAGKGLAGFIQKPYTLEQLTSEIRRVMESPEST
ncbi:hybrid sensor histidine kinase/response regulator [Tuwongella immobilis]|uniref:histidine kinase n=1 Tax=Tuwongella immobilis TaxID=692036 RepID=A0A6C2YJS3_9BACT|nr:response regulator [Tuwongella immobilis]VIP01627.1 blue-light-activated protein : Sensor histidine kinase response regulator, DUF3365, PAS and PAS domain-containing, heme-binding OS=Geobacter sulfurreducens (strain DL-1 / KN400) GN=KN400_2755 PE=4 SV=1: HisKA: HATPase_c: Response_reg [Tuwongella immobilis]VTR98969.1 blue-light-activated protein : Sensor histidine kinase response regulator, DUF3365, PAS and PAS domain-containing, heme-binding OS=Geobacter sulfurreducens (strain DL-1 / KN400) G